MQKKLAALLVIPMITILIAFVPQTAVSTPTSYGPVIEHIRYPTYLSPDAQTLAMQREDVEFLTDLIRPMDVETLGHPSEGKTIIGAPYDHFCYFAFNMRCWWFGPIDGSAGPGLALRHAIAHMVPKDELIGTLFKYIVTKIEAPGPPAQGEWYNSNVDPHPYDPVMAHEILLEGGWVWDETDDRWELGVAFGGESAGTPMPLSTFLSPEFETAPTSWEIVRTTVERMTAAGPFAAHPLPFDHIPVDFNTFIGQVLDSEPARDLSWADGGWDLYFLCYSDLGSTANFLYSLFHSSEDIPLGENTMHIHNDALDAQLEIIKTSLVHSEKVEAAQEAYRLLMGTTGYTYTNTTDGIICRVPIYSRAAYSAHDEGLRGIVNQLLTGSDQAYTFANMYWAEPAGHESDIVNGISTKQAGYMVKFCNQEPLQTPLNPAWASSAYTWMVMDYIYDSLYRTNPYTLESYAWILNPAKDPDWPDTPGYFVEETAEGGMNVTYWLIDDTPLWHDGHQIDAFDCEFAWEYQREYTLGQWWDTFAYFRGADVIDVPANRTIKAYFNETSQFFPGTLAGMALCFPEHIWGCTHERGGRATPSCVYRMQDAYLADGTLVSVESGLCGCAPGPAQTAPYKTTCAHGSGCVIDHPGTTENEVIFYDPSTYSWDGTPDLGGSGTPEFPWLTELVASGEFIFKSYNNIAFVSDIIAFDAGRTGHPDGNSDVHYFKSTAELRANLEYMFHRAGDVDSDGSITDVDQSRMEDAMFTDDSMSIPPWDPPADVNEDGVVEVRDVTRLNRNYGDPIEWPIPVP